VWAPPPELLRELGCRLGLPAPPVVRDSWTGATSTVLRFDGELCVKVPHDEPAAVASCLTHARVVPVARRLGVTAPEVLAVEHLDGVSVPVVVSRFLPGETLPRVAGDAGIDAVWRAVGADLARLHAASRDEVALELRTFHQHDEVDPLRLAEEAATAGHLDATTVGAVADLRARLVGDVLPDDRPVLCHGDVHTENVVVRSGRYGGLIDFAGAGWLDAAWDFATVPLSAVAPSLDGYARAGGSADGLLPRIAWCRLQLALHRAPTSADARSVAARAVREAEQLLTGATSAPPG
jgi:aminoglycoside phosphotransferase